ncbi:superinfection immunity protein [Psychrobacillus sp. INOP01]|nr:superinfection immunity protein [Psychrobacillus sp. INOP01]
MVILFFLLALILVLAIYFLPTIIAALKKKTNFLPILLLNLLLGWSLIGWIVALIWATTKDSSAQQIIIQNNQSQEGSK